MHSAQCDRRWAQHEPHRGYMPGVARDASEGGDSCSTVWVSVHSETARPARSPSRRSNGQRRRCTARRTATSFLDADIMHRCAVDGAICCEGAVEKIDSMLIRSLLAFV